MLFHKKFVGYGLITVLSSLMFVTVACDRKPKTLTSQKADQLVLGVVDGKEINVSNLSEQEKDSLYKMQKQFYDATENLLSQHYFNQYLEEYRQKNKLETQEKAREHFFDANAKVAKADITKFLQENASSPQLQQIPENKREEIVGNYLKQMSQSKAMQSFIQSALNDGKIVVTNISKPVAPTFVFKTEGYPLLKDTQTPITIVEFADYQCPYCVMAHTELQKVLEHYNKDNKTKVQFVYYDFPLSFHDQAVPASVAAYCAGQQNQFWSMHNKIFARQPRDAITADTFSAHAESLKLDMTLFKKCQEDPKSTEIVNAQMAEGYRVGVQGTPALFINGVKYEKQTSFENLKAEIDALI